MGLKLGGLIHRITTRGIVILLGVLSPFGWWRMVSTLISRSCRSLSGEIDFVVVVVVGGGGG